MLLRHAPQADTMVVTIGGEPIAPEDVDGLCARVRGALGACDAELLVCDVASVRSPDAVTVDLLARLALLARRQHRRMTLTHVPLQLTNLLRLAGLADVPGLCLEPERLTERGEDPFDVEEEGDRADPVA